MRCPRTGRAVCKGQPIEKVKMHAMFPMRSRSIIRMRAESIYTGLADNRGTWRLSVNIHPLLRSGNTAERVGTCQICAPPSYIFFEVCSKCNYTRLARCIWNLLERDRDLCIVSGHKTVLLFHEFIASLRELSKEIKEIAIQHDPIRKEFILLERITVPQSQTDR